MNNEIKVGSFYGQVGNIFEVKYVSNCSFSNVVVLSNLMHGEFGVPLDIFKKNYTLVNKPKKQIKLLGFISNSGQYSEYVNGSIWLSGEKIISERIIEVEDD